VNETTGNSSGPPADGSAEYEAVRAAARTAAVEALTRAARLRHPEYGQLDFAEFAADVLARVAANVGGVDRLLAGRPGSWEAAKVGDLLYSTVGYDEELLPRYRSEPVVIHLNVHRLMVNRATGPDFLTGYEREWEACERRWDAVGDEEFDERLTQATTAEFAAIDARWAARYAGYARRFTAAVHAAAAQLDGLDVPVRVEAETAPTGAGDTTPAHPEDIDYDSPDLDPLALRLWDAAMTAVPVPVGDLWPDEPTEPGGEE
jgi:hypothetical protein